MDRENYKKIKDIAKCWFESGKPLLQCINEIAPDVDEEALKRLFKNYTLEHKINLAMRWRD